MQIAIFGGSGFIGQHIVASLLDKGYRIVIVSRSTRSRSSSDSQVNYLTWEEVLNDPSLLNASAYVNLSGETINQRWTEAAKQRILDSRVNATRQVAEIIRRTPNQPKILVQGSAIGIYGHSETQQFQESSEVHATDFLAEVVKAWEHEVDSILNVRIVKFRTGVVLSHDGGAFPKMSLPYQLGIGGPVGSGSQWLSWIHIKDLVDLLEYCIQNNEIQGPLNATAPSPVTNHEFGKSIARHLNKPHWLPLPAVALRLLFGEMGDLLLKGQFVFPSKALSNGFHFTYSDIHSAMKQLTQKK